MRIYDRSDSFGSDTSDQTTSISQRARHAKWGQQPDLMELEPSGFMAYRQTRDYSFNYVLRPSVPTANAKLNDRVQDVVAGLSFVFVLCVQSWIACG